VGPIPFQEGEFRDVLASSFSLSPAPADLENLLVTCRQQAFHAEFRRRMEEPRPGGDSIDMGFRGGGGDAMGSFNFQIALIDEEEPNSLNELCPSPQRGLAFSEPPVFN
jgi:hypothetical protein